jgi:uncharacterized LabA/DUF88 family protein
VRTAFLVDGFNVYHSAKAIERNLEKRVRWLDLRSLLASCLPVIGRNAVLQAIYYFSALADHRDHFRPGTTARHSLYIEALRSTGVVVELGRFKFKEVWCDVCKKKTPAHEEKETDVAIACRLLELLQSNQCDAAVLVTGDTDLAPAVRTAHLLHPAKPIFFAFPYARQNQELKKLVPGRAFKLRAERYSKHQFADPLILPGGRTLSKPSHW